MIPVGCKSYSNLYHSVWILAVQCAQTLQEGAGGRTVGGRMSAAAAEVLFVFFTDGFLRTAVCVGLARVSLSQSPWGRVFVPMPVCFASAHSE